MIVKYDGTLFSVTINIYFNYDGILFLWTININKFVTKTKRIAFRRTGNKSVIAKMRMIVS